MTLGIRHWAKSKSEKPSFWSLSANLVSKRGGGQLARVCRRIILRGLKALRFNHNFRYCAPDLGLETFAGLEIRSFMKFRIFGQVDYQEKS